MIVCKDMQCRGRQLNANVDMHIFKTSNIQRIKTQVLRCTLVNLDAHLARVIEELKREYMH